ncbi:MAG TPA: large conductance mechanosensitive channel protein MscL [Candidatus Limnocylindrales bacterium]|nr:large conductance mechanosensitive channel protein MscL [Candidatus Limnocylindrales bacterium]
MLGEFRDFLLKTNALALAIGVIIGAALGTVVTSLVEDIITPPIGQLLGGVDFSQLAINLDQDGSAAIRYGEFLNAVITFVIIAFVVWSLSRAFIREEAPPAVNDCPYCLEAIPRAATKCRACGSNVAA